MAKHGVLVYQSLVGSRCFRASSNNEFAALPCVPLHLYAGCFVATPLNLGVALYGPLPHSWYLGGEARRRRVPAFNKVTRP